MSHLQYFDYEGFGERSKREINYSQAVRIDNRIEISGQGIITGAGTHHVVLIVSRWLESPHGGVP